MWAPLALSIAWSSVPWISKNDAPFAFSSWKIKQSQTCSFHPTKTDEIIKINITKFINVTRLNLYLQLQKRLDRSEQCLAKNHLTVYLWTKLSTIRKHSSRMGTARFPSSRGQSAQPPDMQTPLEADPSGCRPPPGGRPPPRYMGYYEIRSTSGRYAYYWNAFLPLPLILL